MGTLTTRSAYHMQGNVILNLPIAEHDLADHAKVVFFERDGQWFARRLAWGEKEQGRVLTGCKAGERVFAVKPDPTDKSLITHSVWVVE